MSKQHTGAFLLAAATLFTAAAAHGAPPANAPPNVIFILADDLGYGDLGAYGQQKIKTPHIDKLAAEGMRFTRHYSGSPVCAPSRCVLLTGMHPGHALVRNNIATPPEGQYPLPPDTVTLPRLLQAKGYATGAFGKWGLGGPGSTGAPGKQGIDQFFGYLCQAKAHNFYPPYLWENEKRVDLKNPVMKLPDRLPDGADPKDPASYKAYVGPEYSGDLIFEQARRFLRANHEKPFFLFVPTTIPHLALQAPEDALAEYRGKWEDPPYPGGKGYLPQHAPRAAYAAMVSRLDREVGRLLDIVKELKLDERTIVIFSSDNGPLPDRFAGTDSEFFNSTGGLRGFKGSLYEGGFRVPGIVRWPGKIAAGSTSERVTGFEDWLPTLLELTGQAAATPRGLDGISFAPTLLGKEQPPRPFLYREFPAYGGQQMARIGDWKGVRQKLVPPANAKVEPNLHIELYNLRDDPKETKDVSAQHPEVVAQLEKLMREQHVPAKNFAIPALDRK